MTKKIACWLGIIATFITLVGALYAYDKAKADVKELQLVSMRLDQKILQDEIKFWQEQIINLKMNAMKLNRPLTPHEEKLILQYQNKINLLMVELSKKS